jgi:formamidopyrimidine-DNA glycosylase
MPELPEVETMCRGLAPTVGSTIQRIEFPDIPYRPIVTTPSPSQWTERLVGRKILGIERVAKRVVILVAPRNYVSEKSLACFTDKLEVDEVFERQRTAADRIVFQPKMAGIAMITDPPSAAHTRVVLHLSGTSCERILYWDRRGLGTAHIWTPSEFELYLGPSVLGPDALSVTPDAFAKAYKPLNRPVKPALLDQRLVAGVGNLYASEILHRSCIHPERKCDQISLKSWQLIHRSMQEILLDAIAHEGSTLNDGTYRNAINGEGGYQNHHRVYGREGEHCLNCHRSTIVRIVQSQRSTFYCKTCQPR